MKKYLYLLLFLLISLSLHATSTEELKFISGIINSSCNVVESTYNVDSGVITYKTRNGKERTCIYVWNERNKEGKITISKETLQQAKQVDYVIIGYGQSSCNPAHYYFMSSKRLKTSNNIKKIKRFQLNRPITNNLFE
ncbi:MAG: hypothetical protein IKK07_08205 [Bacteroides sp.]|nr:hypothetical protein [Bacteroides sp.]